MGTGTQVASVCAFKCGLGAFILSHTSRFTVCNFAELFAETDMDVFFKIHRTRESAMQTGLNPGVNKYESPKIIHVKQGRSEHYAIVNTHPT